MNDTWQFEDSDPLRFAAFVYKITNTITNEYYIGYKPFYQYSKKKIKKESNWREYRGSSKVMTGQYEQYGEDVFRLEVLHLCYSPYHARWLEAVEIIKTDGLTDPLCLNGNVMITINHKAVKGFSNPDRQAKYLKDIKKQRIAANLLGEDDA